MFFLIIVCSFSALNTYGEKITTDSKGNIYLLGLVQDSITFSDSTTIYTNSFPYENAKTYLVKLDPAGSVIWYKLFDQDDENYFDIKVDHADHLVLASLLTGTIALDSSTILEDLAIYSGTIYHRTMPIPMAFQSPLIHRIIFTPQVCSQGVFILTALIRSLVVTQPKGLSLPNLIPPATIVGCKKLIAGQLR